MLPVSCVVDEGEAVAAGATRPSASSDGLLVTPPPSSPSAAMVRVCRSVMSRAVVLDAAALAGRREAEAEAEAEAGRSAGAWADRLLGTYSLRVMSSFVVVVGGGWRGEAGEEEEEE